MHRLNQWRRRLEAFLQKDRLAAEMDEEMRFHLEMEAEELTRTHGLTLEEARRQARLAFGGIERFKEEGREARGVGALDELASDLRFTARWLRRSPGFTAVALLTLMLGIGAPTAIFSAVSALLLRPLPYAEADRIVLLAESERESPKPGGTTSYLNALDWRERSRSLETVAIFNRWSPAFTGHGEPEVLAGASVTAEIFDVLRVRPALGRPILPADNQPGSERVVVVSHGFWQRRLHGDPEAVGRVITLNGIPRTVVGVLPRDFRGFGALEGEVWANSSYDPADTRDARYLFAVGRLQRGVTLDAARQELATLAAELERAYPAENRGMTVVATPLREGLVGDVRQPLLALLGAAVLVLLIVCANLSNLLLTRATARERELGIRMAMGARGVRLVRQLITESTVLVGAGAALGIGFAAFLIRVIGGLAPEAVRSEPLTLSGPALLFSLLLVVVCVGIVGALPALRVRRLDLQAALRQGGRGSTGGGAAMRVRRALVVGQLALALTLLGATGLLIRSLMKLAQVDPGIRTEEVLTLSLNLPAARYAAGSEPAFFERLLEEVRALPAVRSAAVTSIIPLGGDWDRIAVDVEGRPVAEGAHKPEADRYIVSPDYFATMGISLRAGRLPGAQDRYDQPLVAVVDEVFARRIAPAGDAIGKQMRLPGRDSLATIIGVVGHVKHYGLDQPSGGQIYMSHLQYPWRWMNLMVRTDADPLSLAPAVRSAVWSLDPDQPIAGISTMEQWLAERNGIRRFVLVLLAGFAGFAVLLAALGLYGVIAQGVVQRRKEIGIRLAVGATPAAVLRMILRQGAMLAGLGAGIGLGGVLLGGMLLQHLLFGIGAHDPAVLAATVSSLVLVALAASYLPARRAARISPLESLRSE